jgi:uncharacterized SAM-binding protein YcdF (DUF218 family)
MQTYKAHMAEVRVLWDFLVDQTPTEDIPSCDAIFIFGHNEPIIALHAAELYRRNKAHIVLVSGGVGPKTRLPEGFRTEAEHYTSLMVKSGVPSEHIIPEDKATNTLENVTLGMPLLLEQIPNLRSLILVAMPPLLLRSSLTVARHHPTVTTFGSGPTMNLDQLTDSRVVRMLGEIDRLDEYAGKGDILPIPIPPQVRAAHDVLRTALCQ